MNETIRTAAISPLRQCMIDDMNVRRFSRETQRNYVRDVGRLAQQGEPVTVTKCDRLLRRDVPRRTMLRGARRLHAHRAGWA